MIKETPCLEGNLVMLRPFQEKYITAEYIDWLNDAEIVFYSEQRHRQHTFDMCLEYYQQMKRQNNYFWAIFDKSFENEKHIGNITAYVDRHNKVADLAILIGDKHSQKKGFGKEAWILACTYLLDLDDIRKITAGTMATNTAMLNLMWKTGMTQEGLRQKQFLLSGEEVDLILASKFKE